MAKREQRAWWVPRDAADSEFLMQLETIQEISKLLKKKDEILTN